MLRYSLRHPEAPAATRERVRAGQRKLTLGVAQQKQYPYPTVRDQRGPVPPGPRVGPWNSPPLGDGPFLFDSYEQRGLRAVVVAKGLSHPWSIAFLPENVILITERQGRLRVVRNAKLEAEPVAGIPQDAQ